MLQLFGFFALMGLGIFIVWNVVIPALFVMLALIVGGIASIFRGNR
jgi:hypothetical protein